MSEPKKIREAIEIAQKLLEYCQKVEDCNCLVSPVIALIKTLEDECGRALYEQTWPK